MKSTLLSFNGKFKSVNVDGEGGKGGGQRVDEYVFFYYLCFKTINKLYYSSVTVLNMILILRNCIFAKCFIEYPKRLKRLLFSSEDLLLTVECFY
jgi:hypothetical protein